MSNKIPCGGFYLDDMLNVNGDGELSINGSTPYQQLVTDGEGGVKWEDRLAYSDGKIVVNATDTTSYVLISDEIPDGEMYDGNYCWVFQSKGSKKDIMVSQIDSYLLQAGPVLFALTDNVEYIDIILPKRGIYFWSSSNSNTYVTGISFGSSSSAPEITWDGKVENVKTIDSKYIPGELNEIILPSSTSGSSKKFKITVDDSGAITATQVT